MGKDVLSKIRANDVYKGLVRVLSDYNIEDYEIRDKRPHPCFVIRYCGIEREFQFPGTPRGGGNVRAYTASFRRFLKGMQMEALDMEMRPQVPSRVGQVHVPMQGSLFVGKQDSGELTMSSREIAELLETRHADVCRTIDRLMARNTIKGYPPTAYTHPQNRQTYSEYHVCKRDSFVIVAQLSPEFTARIVDRWQELEGIVAKPTIDLNDPAWLRGQLLSYTEKVIALQETVAAQQPKVEALERIAEADGSLCITDAAKTLQVVPNVLFKWLDRNGWTYTRVGSSERRAYQTKINAGYLEHKVKTGPRPDGTEWVSTQVRVTPKGLAFLAEVFPPAVRAA